VADVLGETCGNKAEPFGKALLPAGDAALLSRPGSISEPIIDDSTVSNDLLESKDRNETFVDLCPVTGGIID
jgi:hypothetical protein